jgi:hypothetical protein
MQNIDYDDESDDNSQDSVDQKTKSNQTNKPPLAKYKCRPQYLSMPEISTESLITSDPETTDISPNYDYPQLNSDCSSSDDDNTDDEVSDILIPEYEISN